MPRWYIAPQGQVAGPFSLDELRQEAAAGKLTPADVVCPEGATQWQPAASVANLFASAPVIPVGKPVAPPPAQPRRSEPLRAKLADPPAQRPIWITVLLAVPKPILFAVCGGLGGLFGAVFLGETFWLLASPPSVTPQTPHVEMAVPATMKVYASGRNRFNVKIARHGFEGAVHVRPESRTEGLTVTGGFIDDDEDETEIQVHVPRAMPAGKHRLPLIATGPGGIRVTPAEAAITLNVLAPPTSLRLSASAEVAVYRGGKAKLTVKLARAEPNDRIALRFEGMPPGVNLADVVVPDGQDEIEVEVTAARDAAVGQHKFSVEATVVDQPKARAARQPIRLEVLAPPVPKVDVLFVLDLTGSMQFAINGVKDGVRNFVKELEKKAIDSRIGMICFRDIEDDRELPYPLQFNGETFTTDYEAFRAKVATLKADGGGDEPESSLQALALAAKQPFREYCSRVLIFITDAPPKVHNRPGKEYPPYTVEETVELLKPRNINQFHQVVRKQDYDRYYGRFMALCPGSFFDISKAPTGQAFAELLPKLGEEISLNTVATAPPPPKANTVPPPLPAGETTMSLPPADVVPTLKAVQSTQTYAAADRIRLLAAIAGWTMLITAAASMLIVCGQAFYARQSFVGPLDAVKALGGGLLAGVIGGCAGQVFFMLTSGGLAWEGLSRIAGWSLLGALIGVGLALVVPNLKWYRGLAGGFLGGFLGALAFVVVSFVLGPLLGRWLGAAILGFCIGLMVALAELAFRRWWLEVSFGPREVRTITLGTAAVSIGGDDRQVSVYVPGTAALALRYRVDDDRVFCEDVAASKTAEVQPGDRRALGQVTVTLCSTATARHSGFVLRLAGRDLRLSDGLPLLAEDVQGLQAQGTDGVVALVSRRPNDPNALLLRNRSRQTWQVQEPNGTVRAVGPGLGVELVPGLTIQFGAVQGVLVHQGH
jgi:hypothetical protein